jgi:hypothetical protein
MSFIICITWFVRSSFILYKIGNRIINKIKIYIITSSTVGKRRSLSCGGVIARGPRRSGGGVFSLSIVFHISTIFFALPMVLNTR